MNEAGLEVEEIEEGLVVRGRCRGPLERERDVLYGEGIPPDESRELVPRTLFTTLRPALYHPLVNPAVTRMASPSRRTLLLGAAALLCAEGAQAFAPSSLRAFGAAKAQLPAVRPCLALCSSLC